jgi:hypothetical protein
MPVRAPVRAALPIVSARHRARHPCALCADPFERSLSAAKLIDMYAVKRNPERTATISIAKPPATTEFLTRFLSSAMESGSIAIAL